MDTISNVPQDHPVGTDRDRAVLPCQQPHSEFRQEDRRVAHQRVTAEVISCPGHLRDDAYPALQINVEGFESPYVLTLALRTVGYRALSEQSDPLAVYSAIASAVNNANITVAVMRQRRASQDSLY